MKNNEWKRVYILLVAAVLFILLIVVASGTMDGMSGRYAVMFVSLFLSITAFAVALLVFTRARVMDEILCGKNLLAHWVCPDCRGPCNNHLWHLEIADTGALKAIKLIPGLFLFLIPPSI
ncbi:MAG: hypothetical protein WCP36_07670 [Methanomicrobiales archaeon]